MGVAALAAHAVQPPSQAGAANDCGLVCSEGENMSQTGREGDSTAGLWCKGYHLPQACQKRMKTTFKLV